MATLATPKNKSVNAVAWSAGGAELLMEIAGLGSKTDFIPEVNAVAFGNKILDFLKKNPNHENFAWLKHKAKFFLECQGFWQS